jgi:oxygen-dependent protoporphyrinogen oxidase
VPAPAAAGLLRPIDEALGEALAATPYASVAVVATGFPKDAIGHDLSGFGFLVPGREGRRILGSLWSSSIYPEHRAPPGQVLLRTLVGGARAPELATLPDDDLVALVRAELEATMGLRWVEPTHLRIFRWPAAIPQYPVGHLARVAEVEARLAERYPGLVVTGNHLHGIGINDCTADAERVARLVVGASREQRHDTPR